MEMPLVHTYEMIADLAARSNEMGTSVRDFVTNAMPKKYGFAKDSELHKELLAILDTLVNPPFDQSLETTNDLRPIQPNQTALGT